MDTRNADSHIPAWVLGVGIDILRRGYSDRQIARLVPDFLRIIVETENLDLLPRAALFRQEGRDSRAILAGVYNMEWTAIERELEPCTVVSLSPDPYSDAARLCIPFRARSGKIVGQLLVYAATSAIDAATVSALETIVSYIAVILLQDERNPPVTVERAQAQVPSMRQVPPTATDDQRESDTQSVLLSIIQNFPGGICVLSADMTVTVSNRQFYDLLDLPVDLFAPGCNFGDILRYNARRGEYGPGDVDALAAERIRHIGLFIEHSFCRDTHSGQIIEVRAAPTPGGGCVVTYVDVTAREKAERSLRHHSEKLEEMVSARTGEIERQARELERLLVQERQINELQRQFVAMASHEFRTPLAIIDGAAQRLIRRKEEITPAFLAEKVAQIRTSVSRIVELMESILSAGRLENGSVDSRLAPCSLVHVLEACCARQSDIKRSHRFHLDLDRLPETIRADASALQQVFTNLLSNSVKYAPQSPDIFVCGWIDGAHIRVSIRDEGVGIDPEDLPKMFQRYFRARTSTGIAGTGIGLNIVKQIVELHGGTISVASERGRGSTFTVTLPTTLILHDNESAAASDAA